MKKGLLFLFVFIFLSLFTTCVFARGWSSENIYNQIGDGRNEQIPIFTHLGYPEIDLIWIGDLASKFRDGWFCRMTGGIAFPKSSIFVEGFVGFGASSKRGFHNIAGFDIKFTALGFPYLLNLQLNATGGLTIYSHDIQNSPKRILIGFPIGFTLSINPFFAGALVGIKVETGIKWMPGIYVPRSGPTSFKWTYLMVQLIGIAVHFRSIS